ncbi:MAG: hypothetical protein CO029_02790 [Candidatus Magasanikbacteria bacterium CG_4_9_14_0_2_um_filter_41_10]|uniref:Uncharacterized protein n=1 Tax=Candidatus Magasanikbacteria bacterium CG_4_10_14_0_2_um_filter_41_31 TaxID=1974639 RepID=A0A2M7V571_9BACT|nr:MAG: hypothetical protein AUJ37_02020 [Candidatus Magasanikbacteria bacterium CG1_02_41_34]PIZ93749.1 MAG: hypothetical protein COX83_01280 [Candidatus Magasanikbacteria bacterium CG_4_10_14_0_2_um_filter_41_31]PJC53433.1 MAG: hypothetical protein CO029_02790 [Candidatus Magasanikbacteria bacterium CG_4_9_14_0_2_um_filter_41_10]
MLGIFLKKYGNKQLSWAVFSIVFLVLLVGAFLFWRNKTVTPEVRGSVEVVGEGIEVVEEYGKKVIVNEEDGYRITVADIEWVKKEPGSLFIDLPDVYGDGIEGGGYKPSISITSHKTSLTALEEAEKWISNQKDSKYYSAEVQKDDTGRTYAVVHDNAFFGGPKPYIFFIYEQTLHVIDADFVDVKEVLDSLRFL